MFSSSRLILEAEPNHAIECVAQTEEQLTSTCRSSRVKLPSEMHSEHQRALKRQTLQCDIPGVS